MNVLHLTTHLDMGGITIYIQRLARFLKPYGVKTHIFSSGGSLESAFLQEGVLVYKRPVRTKNVLHPKLFLQLPFLVRLVRREKIQLIHAHTRVMQGLAFWLSLFTGVPVVTTCHGFFKPKWGRFLMPAWGSRVIAISTLVQEHLEKDMRVPAEKIKMIHNGVDPFVMDTAFNRLTAAEAKSKFGLDPQAPVMGIVARLVKDKGHEFALRALKELSADYPKLQLLIVGNGPHRDNLERLAEELGVTQRVRFTGSVTEVAECLRAMDFFVFPATWREGFGLSVIEAMLCQRPVIVTNIRAVSLLIRHQETGLLVEPSDTAALANALRVVIQSPQERRRLGENARKEVLEHFTMERMAREVWQLYQNQALKAPTPALDTP